MDNEKQSGIKRIELLNQIQDQIDQQKHDVNIYYAELKLKLPAYIKNKTIGELRDAGAIVDPDIHLTNGTENFLKSSNEAVRKKMNLVEKLEEVHLNQRTQINTYYKNLKAKLPNELLGKKMGDLSEEEFNHLGLDIKYRLRQKH